MRDRCESVPEQEAVALGRQMTVEFYDCSPAVLADAGKMKEVFLRAAERSGAHVVDSLFHTFEPQGVSGVVVISESHFAVHAWPEHDYAAVDLFTCGAGVDFNAAVKNIAEGLSSGRWIVSSLMSRGILGPSGVERLVPVVEDPGSHGLQLSWEKRFEHSRARAMSCCIDLYECDAPFSAEDTLKTHVLKFLPLVAEKKEDPVDWECRKTGDSLDFALEFDRGHLTGKMLPAKKNCYLDFFTDGFFDPRPVAEFAIREFQGRYYRMQPQVRQ